MQHLGGVCRDEELSDLTSEHLIQIESFHGRIYGVKLPLELCILLIQLVHVQGHVTDDQTVKDRT